MPSCAVVICKNRSEISNFKSNGITYHRFPKNNKIKQEWIIATNRGPEWMPLKRSAICSAHFEDKCFKPLYNSRRMFEWAIPTLKLRLVYANDPCMEPDIITTVSGRNRSDSNNMNIANEQLSAIPEGYVNEPNDSDVDIKKEPEEYDVPIVQPGALQDPLEFGNPRESMETSTSSEPQEPVGLSPITVKEEPLYTEGTESLDGFILSDASDVEDTPSCSNMIFSNKRPCRVEHQTSAKAPVISCPLCGHVFKAAVTESQVSAEVQSLKQALREKCYLLNNVRDEVSGLKEKNKKLDEELLFYRNHFKSLPQPIKIESLKTHDE